LENYNQVIKPFYTKFIKPTTWD